MKNRLIKPIKKIAPWIVYGVVFAFVAYTLKDHLTDIRHYTLYRPVGLVVAVAAYAAEFWLNAVIWGLLMRYSGARVRMVDSLDVYISSFLVRYIPGNVWAIAVRATMNKVYGVKIISSIWGWVIENVAFLLVGLLFSVFVLLNVSGLSNGVVWTAAIAFPLCCLFLLKYELLERFVRFVAKKKFPDVVRKEVGSFDLSLKHRGVLVLLDIGSWILYSIQFIAVVWAVMDISHVSLLQLAGINALAWSIGYISIITPSGTGIRETVILAGLLALGIAGGVEGVAIALLARITVIIAEVLVFASFKSGKFIRTRGWRHNDRETNSTR